MFLSVRNEHGGMQVQERKGRSLGRLFQLLTVLMGGGRPSTAELASRFKVSQRTIFRDILSLESWGVPIVRENGRCWVLDSYRIRPVQFTPEEVHALMAALDFAGRRRPLGGRSALSAQEKLIAVMSATNQALAAGLGENLVVDPIPGYSLPGLPGVDRQLTAAIQGAHPVRLRYLAMGAEEPTERTVRPYGLAYRGTGLYLIGYCELRQDIRTFRVNRILRADPLPAVFQRPSDFDLEAYLGRIWGIEDGPELQVAVRFARPVASLARETVWHPSQTLEEGEDGSVTLHMVTRGKNELARWLTGYGGHVEVLGPADLREAVLALGRGILDRYVGVAPV